MTDFLAALEQIAAETEITAQAIEVESGEEAEAINFESESVMARRPER
jgi:hypothetical protein